MSAWLDGQLDAVAGLNPYVLADGLHNSGAEGSDFTVGAVDRSGEIGNFFVGDIASLAVYDRGLERHRDGSGCSLGTYVRLIGSLAEGASFGC